MNAKKLPSGSWRVKVFSHYEYRDGKKIAKYLSFTSKDKSRHGKLEAERMALEWRTGRSALTHGTLMDAVRVYIASKEKLLSPSSIRAYRSYMRNHFDRIGSMEINNLNEVVLQSWVSYLSRGHSPKTVKDIVGLLSSAYHLQTGRYLNVTLPQPKKADLHTPTDKEIQTLLKYIKGTPLETAVMLSALCSLRRGEICALTPKDFSDGFVCVSKTMVRDVTGDWIIKEPKTPGSVRTVPIPQGMKVGPIDMNPDELTKKFRRAVRKCGMKFRFHDLRHYYASTAHYLGLPDAYIMANGGWKTDSVMKRVYREALEDKKAEENKKIEKHYKKVFHKIFHDH